MFAALLVAIAALSQTPVVDNAHLLSADQAMIVRQQFDEAQHTNNVNLGLLTLPFTDDPKATAIEAIDRFHLGPNSVILLVSMNPKMVYIQPGTALTNIFTQRLSTSITREMAGNFRTGDFGGGILNGVTSIRSSLPVLTAPRRVIYQTPPPMVTSTPTVAAPTVTASGDSNVGSAILWLAAILSIIALATYGVRRSRARRIAALDPFGRPRGGGFTPYRSLRTPDRQTFTGTGAAHSDGGLLTGILIGESLNRPTQQVVVRDREVIREAPAPTPAPSGGGSSFSSDDDSSRSSGGGGSSWDSGSSSSGGGSSFDSGGGSGFDSGSSGGDSGGGSSW